MFSPRPNILFLGPTWPLGATFGGQLRALHVARALQQLGKVTFVVVGSNAPDAASAVASSLGFAIEPPVNEYLASTRSPADRLRRAFDPTYLNLHGVVASAADRARIEESICRHDLVWIMNCRTPNILQIWRWPHTHLDIDDLPSTNPERGVGRSAVQRLNWRARRLLLQRRERSLPRRFTTLSVCSEADRTYLGLPAVHVIPNGFERPSSPPARHLHPNQPRIGFIGLYSHLPNLDGVRWLLDEIWPRIRRAIPGIRFRLVGRDSDGELQPNHPDVDALGWMADPAGEIATWSAMVIPIRFGGGTRIKIADAFSRKCPVVSTAFGAYGYDVRDGDQLCLANDPDAFAQACIRLVRDPSGAAAMAERAWKDFLAKWTWDTIAPKVAAAAEDCLRRSTSKVA